MDATFALELQVLTLSGKEKRGSFFSLSVLLFDKKWTVDYPIKFFIRKDKLL